MMLTLVPVPALAAQTIEYEIAYLDDGGYIETWITESVSRASGTKTGDIIKQKIGSDGNPDWKITLTGTFTYDGTSATCTKSECTVQIYNDQWTLVRKSSGRAGAQAFATVVLEQKVLGITVAQPQYDLTLNCDKDGNLS